MERDFFTFFLVYTKKRKILENIGREDLMKVNSFVFRLVKMKNYQKKNPDVPMYQTGYTCRCAHLEEKKDIFDFNPDKKKKNTYKTKTLDMFFLCTVYS